MSARPARPRIAFTKMSAGGNDFLVVAAADASTLPDLPRWVRAVCRRGLSVGADGVLIVGPEEAGVRLAHYNADGGRSSLCGNGTRCAARWARLRGLAAGDRVLLRTDVGEMEALASGEGRVELALGLYCPAPEPRDLERAGGAVASGYFLELGVPHFLIPVESVEGIPVAEIGAELRGHPRLGAPGANVSFVARPAGGDLAIRTFERGVEAETWACGTACVAAGVLAVDRGWAVSPLTCRPRSGFPLEVRVERAGAGYAGLHLTGDARVIYEGQLEAEALDAPRAGLP